MKYKLMTLILAAAALVPSCTKGPGPLQGAIDFLAGTVTITDGGTEAAAKIGDPVSRDGKITTSARSFARVAIGGDAVEVYEKSMLVFSGLSRDEKTEAEKTNMQVEKGTVFSRVSLDSARGDSFKASSGVMVATVREGAEFLYAVDGTNGTVACYKGSVSVLMSGSDEEVVLKAGQMLAIEPGKKAKAVAIPSRFRYRDFEYGKNAYLADGASGAGGAAVRDGQGTVSKTGVADRSGLTSSGKQSSGSAAGNRSTSGSTTAGKTAATTKKSAGGSTTAEKTSVTSKKSTGGSTTSEKSAVTGKDTGSTTTSKKTAAGETKSTAISTAIRTVKPGGLLDKPRVSIPELK